MYLSSVAPDPVSNCTIINKSSETFHLQCIPGFDGGMEQMFHVTVADRATGVTHFNKTTRELDLFIEVGQGLEPMAGDQHRSVVV